MLPLHKYIQSAISLCLTARNTHFTDEKRDFRGHMNPYFAVIGLISRQMAL
jgi:hypothetical protein